MASIENYRLNDERTKQAILWLKIVLGLKVLMILSSCLQYSLLLDMQEGLESAFERAEANDLRESLVALAYLAGFVTCVVMYIRWFRRAYYNLNALGKKTKHSEGWAAGVWFVPIISLYRPYQMTVELFSKSRALLIERGQELPHQKMPTYLGLWWALWLITSTVQNVVQRAYGDSPDVDKLINLTIAEIVVTSVTLILTILVIKLVSEYRDIQNCIVASNSEFDTTEKQDIDSCSENK